jgi:DNA-nicking Smr family endonuclease
MRQERAFAALFSFLRHAQQRGQKIVLVITGRGREGDEGRGVLRATVPAWLARPDFRDLVAGVEEAGRRHGGAGALYVRLRRRGRRDRLP